MIIPEACTHNGVEAKFDKVTTLEERVENVVSAEISVCVPLHEVVREFGKALFRSRVCIAGVLNWTASEVDIGRHSDLMLCEFLPQEPGCTALEDVLKIIRDADARIEDVEVHRGPEDDLVWSSQVLVASGQL